MVEGSGEVKATKKKKRKYGEMQKNQKKPQNSAGKGKTAHNVCTVRLLDDAIGRKYLICYG